MPPEEPYRCPFTILIDTAESQPFLFQNLQADADHEFRPIAVAIKFVALGRHPNSIGDYSIEGMTDQIAVERKSMEDAQSTVLGWKTEYHVENELPGRRQRFEKELDNLQKLAAAMVVVEATFDDCLRLMPEWGVKPAKTNAKIFLRSVLAYMQDYKVPWLFVDGRRAAEVATFRFLERFHRKQLERRKDAQRHAKECGF